MEAFIYKDKKLLRCGYTTGTCAALAARAAALGLVSGKIPEESVVHTPSGERIRAAVECPVMKTVEDGNGVSRAYAECAIRKDAGDDYDVTDKILIVCRAEFTEKENSGHYSHQVWIEGGTGVGRVTKKGLNQPVGQAAINEVPRSMIRQAVCEVLEETGETRTVKITVSVPEGAGIAEKTFNPVLGITGGISILGTTGIVKPMSEEALVETIHAHLRVLRAAGRNFVAAVPGNMGGEALDKYLKQKSDSVLCSNFIGTTIDQAAECGFSGLLFAGHLGKLVKLGNGIMNTHSREGDGRMDTLISCGLQAGADICLLKKVQAANTTEEAMEMYREAGLKEPVLNVLLGRIHRHLKRRAPEQMKIGVLLFSLETGCLGETKEAGEILAEIRKEQEAEKLRK